MMHPSTYGRYEKCIQNFIYETWMNKPAWRHKCTWDDKIHVDPQQIGWGGGMVWVYLDQNRGQWKAVVEMVMSLQFP